MLKEKSSSKDTSPTKSGIKEKKVSRLGGSNPLVRQFQKAAVRVTDQLTTARKLLESWKVKP